MKLRILAIVGCAMLLAGGCAAHGPKPGANPTASATTRPASGIANLTLDQIEPKLVLPAPLATTQPAPLDALVLYARARDVLLQNQRYTAINLIDQALQLDPDSFELNYALGRAYLGAGGMNDQALTAFERAAKIDPDNLEVQTELGRAYQSRNQNAKAIERFRLAMQTEDYGKGDPLAAVVDYRLGLLLEQDGHTRAALDCYLSLLNRLQHPGVGARPSPEVNYLLSRPELVYEAIGHLQETLGDYEAALHTYQDVAHGAPTEFGPQSWVVQMLLKLHRNEEAMSAATDLVRNFHASAESISLLRDVHEKTGSGQHFADALRELYRQHPDDKAILFALADTLAGSGHLPQAAEMLSRSIDVSGGNFEIVQRLYRLWIDRDDIDEAAGLIIRVSAAHPESVAELQDLFVDLARPTRRKPLRLPALQKLQVAASSETAKQYWVWRLEAMLSRTAAARTSLEQAANARIVFDPACRDLLDVYLERNDMDLPAKQQAITALLESVRSRGRSNLAIELSGIVALANNQPDDALKQLAEAIRIAPNSKPSADLQLEYALVLQRTGAATRFEQLVWKLLGEHPHYTAAYQNLLTYYRQSSNEQQTWNLINAWLGADPTGVAPRINFVGALIAAHRDEDAIAQMRRLFDEHPDDADVVGNLRSLLVSASQTQQLLELLEAERLRHPGNQAVVGQLAGLYTAQNRISDVTRVLEAARTADAGDPDQLYFIANLYHLIDQPQITEQILQDVMKLDPNHPQAGNDLGYTWADQGKNLDRAESMIRIAVKAEPENQSYQDSLGWVLYKRSRFDQALQMLQQASQPVDQADPIVLDHLGDALYRLGRATEARQAWQLSVNKIGEQPTRKELQDLRPQLEAKIRQTDAGQPADVAPVVESAPSREQAKN